MFKLIKSPSYFLLFIFLSIHQNSLAVELIYEKAYGFKWMDDQSHEIMSINTQKLELIREDILGKTIVIGKLKTLKDVFKDLPQFFNTGTFLNDDKLVFTVHGTGQVYELNPQNLIFKRLDKTYHRGYNFNANQFIRRDTLYSFGGGGFWMNNGITTFFNNDNKEWDILISKNRNTDFIGYGESGYNTKLDKFFSFFPPSGNISIPMMEPLEASNKVAFKIFDFKTKTWSQKGIVKPYVIEFLKENTKSLWTGKYLILFSSAYLIIDPFNNKVYKIEKKIDFTLIYEAKLIHHSDKNTDIIYTIRDNVQTTLTKHKLDSVSIGDLIKNSIVVGALYEEDDNNLKLYIYSISGLLIISFILFIFIKNRRKSIELTEDEIHVLTVFFDLEHKASINTEELNIIFRLQDKSYDNQRKIRNSLLEKLNDKLKKKFLISNAIQKTVHVDDKRLNSYALNDKIRSKGLKAILK